MVKTSIKEDKTISMAFTNRFSATESWSFQPQYICLISVRYFSVPFLWMGFIAACLVSTGQFPMRTEHVRGHVVWAAKIFDGVILERGPTSSSLSTHSYCLPRLSSFTPTLSQLFKFELVYGSSGLPCPCHRKTVTSDSGASRPTSTSTT